jgi:hypothetical protein
MFITVFLEVNENHIGMFLNNKDNEKHAKTVCKGGKNRMSQEHSPMSQYSSKGQMNIPKYRAKQMWTFLFKHIWATEQRHLVTFLAKHNSLNCYLFTRMMCVAINEDTNVCETYLSIKVTYSTISINNNRQQCQSLVRQR